MLLHSFNHSTNACSSDGFVKTKSPKASLELPPRVLGWALACSAMLSACGGGGTTTEEWTAPTPPADTRQIFNVQPAYLALMQSAASYRALYRAPNGATLTLEQRVSSNDIPAPAGSAAERGLSTVFLETVADSRQPQTPLSEDKQIFISTQIGGQPGIWSGRLENRPFGYRRFTLIQKLSGSPEQRFSVGMTQQRFLDATVFTDDTRSKPLYALRMDWSLQDRGRPGQAWLCFKRRYYPADANFLANTDYYDIGDASPLKSEERCYDIDVAGNLLGGFRSVSVDEKGVRMVFE